MGRVCFEYSKMHKLYSLNSKKENVEIVGYYQKFKIMWNTLDRGRFPCYFMLCVTFHVSNIAFIKVKNKE